MDSHVEKERGTPTLCMGIGRVPPPLFPCPCYAQWQHTNRGLHTNPKLVHTPFCALPPCLHVNWGPHGSGAPSLPTLHTPASICMQKEQVNRAHAGMGRGSPHFSPSYLLCTKATCK